MLKIETKQIETKLEGSQGMPPFLAVPLSISQLGVLYSGTSAVHWRYTDRARDRGSPEWCGEREPGECEVCLTRLWWPQAKARVLCRK